MNVLFKRYLKIALRIAFIFIIIIISSILSREKMQKMSIKEADRFIQCYENGIKYEEENITGLFNKSYSRAAVYSQKYDSYVPDVANEFSANEYLLSSFIFTGVSSKMIVWSFIFTVLFLLISYNDERSSSSNFINSLPILSVKRYIYKTVCGIGVMTAINLFHSILLYIYYLKYKTKVYEISENFGLTQGHYYDNTFNFKILIYNILLCILIFSMANLFANLFGKVEMAFIIAIFSFAGFIIITRGAINFIHNYSTLDIEKIEQFCFKFTLKMLNGNIFSISIIIFSTFILNILSFIASKKIKIENNGKIFLFKWTKYAISIGIFLSGAFSLYYCLKIMGNYVGDNIFVGISILIFGGILSTFVFTKIFKFYI